MQSASAESLGSSTLSGFMSISNKFVLVIVRVCNSVVTASVLIPALQYIAAAFPNATLRVSDSKRIHISRVLATSHGQTSVFMAFSIDMVGT